MSGMNETPAEKAKARAIRRRWLTIGELVAVAGVIAATAFVPDTGIHLDELNWAKDGGDLGFGGWWFLLVSRPIYQLFLFSWLWRVVLLFVLFRRIVKLGLDLLPAHPDRLGGLAFIAATPSHSPGQGTKSVPKCRSRSTAVPPFSPPPSARIDSSSYIIVLPSDCHRNIPMIESPDGPDHDSSTGSPCITPAHVPFKNASFVRHSAVPSFTRPAAAPAGCPPALFRSGWPAPPSKPTATTPATTTPTTEAPTHRTFIPVLM